MTSTVHQPCVPRAYRHAVIFRFDLRAVGKREAEFGLGSVAILVFIEGDEGGGIGERRAIVIDGYANTERDAPAAKRPARKN